MEESGRGSVKIDKTHPGTLGRGRVLVTCRCRGRWKLTPQGAGYPGAGWLPASSPAFPLRFVSVLPPVCPCPKQGLAGAGWAAGLGILFTEMICLWTSMLMWNWISLRLRLDHHRLQMNWFDRTQNPGWSKAGEPRSSCPGQPPFPRRAAGWRCWGVGQENPGERWRLPLEEGARPQRALPSSLLLLRCQASSTACGKQPLSLSDFLLSWPLTSLVLTDDTSAMKPPWISPSGAAPSHYPLHL